MVLHRPLKLSHFNGASLDEHLLRQKALSEASQLISIQELSIASGLSVRTLRRMQAAGLLPSRTRHGRHLAYAKPEALEAASARLSCKTTDDRRLSDARRARP